MSAVIVSPLTQEQGFDSSVSAVIASPLAQRQGKQVSEATSRVITLPLTQEQGFDLATPPVIVSLLTQQGFDLATPLTQEQGSDVLTQEQGIDLVTPPAPSVAASPLTQEQVQALIAAAIAEAQKPKAAWLANAFPVLPEGIENICEGMSEHTQKETANMIGTKWTKTKARANGSLPTKKAKNRLSSKEEQKTSKAELRRKSKAPRMKLPERRSTRERFSTMLYIQGMPELYKQDLGRVRSRPIHVSDEDSDDIPIV